MKLQVKWLLPLMVWVYLGSELEDRTCDRGLLSAPHRVCFLLAFAIFTHFTRQCILDNRLRRIYARLMTLVSALRKKKRRWYKHKCPLILAGETEHLELLSYDDKQVHNFYLRANGLLKSDSCNSFNKASHVCQAHPEKISRQMISSATRLSKQDEASTKVKKARKTITDSSKPQIPSHELKSEYSPESLLCDSIKRNDTARTKQLLDQLTESEIFKHLKKKAVLIQQAVHSNNAEILEMLLEKVTSQRNRLELLMTQDEDGNTALHNATKDLTLVKCILQCLEEHDKHLHLLRIKNRNEKTAVDVSSPVIAEYLADVLRGRCNEPVSVCDNPNQSKKGNAGKRKGKITYRQYDDEVWSSRFSPGVDEILFAFRSTVQASQISPQEICRVYQLSESQLQSECAWESERLLTYESDFGSQYMTATALARAGLINFKAHSDEVVCVWCLVHIRNFKQTVDAVALHFALSAHVCEFVKHYDRKNIPISEGDPATRQKGFLSLTSTIPAQHNQGQLDSGLDSLSLTQGSTITNGTAFTFMTTAREQPQVGQGVTSDDAISEHYIQSEMRSEVLAEPTTLSGNARTQMRYEQNRLRSFIHKGWTNFYSEHLASAGFYLIEEPSGSLTIACPFCDGKITDVIKDTIPIFSKEKDHSPLQVHVLKFPACAFVQGNNLGNRGNVPMIAGEFRWNQSKVVTTAQANVGSELVTMGVATTQADCPPMAVYERRLDSFLTLPYDHPKGAEELATCGFYDSGTQGKTKCFWCGVECDSWSSAEDVWVRHARSMRSCQFVINEKGAELVNHVIEEHGEWIDSQRDEDRIRNVTTRMIQPRMDAPVVQTVISMGYTRDHVKTAIINRLKKLKPDYTSTADLVSDVLVLRNRDMTYHRDLKLPDVPVSPQGTVPDIVNDEGNSEPLTENELVREMTEVGEDHTTGQAETETAKGVLDMPEEERATVTRQMMSQLTCKICISSAVGIIFLPCAHLVCCTSCAAAMEQCPMCRRDIVGTIKASV